MLKKVKKGFTLIELVVVIAVIAILSAVSVVAYVGITNNAKKSAASQRATQSVTAIRAAVLASDKGYTEAETGAKAAITDRVYTVTLDGKELKFGATGDGELTDANKIAIIKDLLGEIGEADLAALNFKFETANEESKLGVLIDGKDVGSTVASDYVWANF